MNKIITIAETGINHRGNIDLAKHMILMSAASKADIVKFQWYDAEKILGKENRVFLEAAKAQFSEQQHFELKKYCDSIGIEWCTSIFHPWQVDRTELIGINRYKVASRSAGDFDLLHEIARTKKPVILSTGLYDGHGEISQVLANLREIFIDNNFTLMYCVCNYPSKAADFDFKRMLWYKKFCDKIGFSNHCPSIYPSLYAVECGAEITENHVVINKNQVGCDISSSIDFGQFKEMVSKIRELNG